MLKDKYQSITDHHHQGWSTRAGSSRAVSTRAGSSRTVSSRAGGSRGGSSRAGSSRLGAAGLEHLGWGIPSGAIFRSAEGPGDPGWGYVGRLVILSGAEVRFADCKGSRKTSTFKLLIPGWG